MSLVEFLRYAGTAAGVNVVIGYVLSFVAEWWPGYEALDAKVKRLIMMGLCFVIPLLSLAGLVLLGEVGGHTGEVGGHTGPPLLDAVWSCLLAGFAAFFGSQAAHLRKLGGQREEARWLGLEQVSNDVVAVCSELINAEKERRRKEGLAADTEALFGLGENKE